MLATATIPLGIVATGFAIELLGLRTTLLTLATLYPLVATTTFINPALRREALGARP